MIVATMPGTIALDYQILRLDTSPLSRPLLGAPLELGLDVAANAQVAALGLTMQNPVQAGHRFRFKPATLSGVIRPAIPA